MAYKVCFSHSESFLEASSFAENQGKMASSRYYLPKVPLEKAIQDFWSQAQIEDVSQIILSLKATRTILKKRLGNPPAVIVSEGFEQWVDMNLPVETPQFTLQPQRTRSPLNSDLIFGLHERMDQNGQPIHKVNEKELEFLVSKLEMSKIKSICVCLLHSSKNNEHELQVKNYFESKGFNAFCSFESGASGNERERWLGAILNGYLESAVKDQIEHFMSVPMIADNKDKISIATGQGLTTVDSQYYFSTMYGDVFLHSGYLNQNESEQKNLFHFGLEECHILYPNKHPQNMSMTDLGRVSVQTPSHKPLSWSFTSPLQTGYWGVCIPMANAIGYEPGPMCLGRGLQPTLLDLLFLEGALDEIPGVSELLNAAAKPRIFDALSSLVKDLNQELLHSDLLHQIVKLALFELASQVSSSEQPVFSGPMAKSIKLLLEKYYSLKGIQLAEDFQYPSLMGLKYPGGLS